MKNRQTESQRNTAKFMVLMVRLLAAVPAKAHRGVLRAVERRIDQVAECGVLENMWRLPAKGRR